MSLCLTPDIEHLARLATGRERSLFADDMAALRERLSHRIRGKRILLAGGAGSIATACLRELLHFSPAALTIIDPNENNAVETLRWVRSGDTLPNLDIAIQPLDFASPLADAFLARQRPFDIALSFAALKHVRSERDIFSLLRMCEINILGTDRFCASLRRHGHGGDGVFFVSTDKAARPTSLMGASKRLMEAVCWAHTRQDAPASLLDGGKAEPLARMTSTRFANVAFSDGSLPWGFLQRLVKHQPLAGPMDVRRYLVTQQESGQLCLLAAFIAQSGRIGIPIMDPVQHSVCFADIARLVLREQGFEMLPCADEVEAKRRLPDAIKQKQWPWVGTISDTSGEKEMEEFLGDGERVTAGSCAAMAEVAPMIAADVQGLGELLSKLRGYVEGSLSLPDKAHLVADFAKLIPDLQHRETGASLDGKM